MSKLYICNVVVFTSMRDEQMPFFEGTMLAGCWRRGCGIHSRRVVEPENRMSGLSFFPWSESGSR